MKKRISFVTTSLVRSGAETVIVRLAKHFYELGFDVEIIMLLNNIVQFELPKEIRVIDFSGKIKSRVLRFWYWIKHLKKHFIEYKPDYIVSFIARVNLLTLIASKRIKSKVVISERNDPRYDSRTKITWFFINKLYPKADKIVFQTDEAKQLFNSKIQERGVVIPNPVEIQGITDFEIFDSNLILYAGRFSEQKDVGTIINAAKIVCSKYPAIRFELYGDGPLKDNFKETVLNLKLEKNIFVYDNVSNIQEVMRKARLFVMSSLYEGMSNSLMEASFSGVPCITTPVLGTSFIVDGQNGFFYPFKDCQKLANIIEQLFSNKEAYLSMRLKAIEMAKTKKHVDTYVLWEKTII